MPCTAQADFQLPLQFVPAESWAGISFSLVVNVFICGITSFQASFHIGLGDVITDTHRSPIFWATGREAGGRAESLPNPSVTSTKPELPLPADVLLSPYCTSRQQKLIKKLQAEEAFREEMQSFQETMKSFREKIKVFREKIRDFKMAIQAF